MARRSQKEVDALATEAANMQAAGMPAEAIAAELGVSIPYLYKLYKQAGIELEPSGGRRSIVDDLDDEAKELIIRVYQTREVPLSSVLAEFGMSYNQMYTLLRREGVDIREFVDNERATRAMRMDIAVKMYEDGAKLWLIEDETGIRQPQLHNELHKRGITLRRDRGKVSPAVGVTRLDKVSDDPVP